MRRILLSFLVSVLYIQNSFSMSVEEFAYNAEWLSLMHYKKTFLGDYESTVGIKSFFVSSEGKNNPTSELQETINLMNSNNISRICMYPARYILLKKHNFIDKEFPKCTDYKKFYSDLSPKGVTLLFTDAYMNNPASLFGHTLLRIDTSKTNIQDFGHAVNYGAIVDEKNTNIIKYAILGLAGGYMGTITVKPYYDIINQYNNVENRDIWEFELNLSREETDYMVAHLWELAHSQTPYYFLTKNCSYMLLEILDSVKPELNLSEDFWLHTIPFDTVKAVNKHENFIKNTNFRASRRTKISIIYDKMNKQEKEAFLNFIKNDSLEFNNLSDDEKETVAETAYLYIQYLKDTDKIGSDDYEAKKQKLFNNADLSLIGEVSVQNEGEESPLYAHNSARVSLGAGARNGDAFQEIMFRPAYHSLIDNTFAYLKGAEINFLNFTARRYDKQNKYVLNNVDLLGIKSYSPRNSIFKPVSYKISSSIDRELNPQTFNESYILNLNGGLGVTYEFHKYFWTYVMFKGHFAYAGTLERNQWAGLGVDVGIISDFGRVRITANAENIFATSKYPSKMKYKTEIAFSINNNLYISASYDYFVNHGKNINESKFNIRYHF